MGHTVFTVNGVIMLDADLDHWQERPPAEVMELMNPKAENRVWMRSALIALVDAAVGDKPTHIDVQTTPMSWSLHVRHMF
jgi:hypothetical protein